MKELTFNEVSVVDGGKGHYARGAAAGFALGGLAGAALVVGVILVVEYAL